MWLICLLKLEEIIINIGMTHPSILIPFVFYRRQKIDGCNKMSCTKCGTLFCWLCNARLPQANPYTHFNVPGSKCYNQLFAGVVEGALLDEELAALAFDQPDAEEQADDAWGAMGFFL